MATVIAVVSDVHAGSTIAVCPPSIDLDDGGSYLASPAQQWLWENWNTYWQRIARLRDELRADLYLVFNGDLTEGYHHHTTQILTANPTAQAAVVDACMKVPLSLGPDRIFMVRGTEAHVGKSAAYEERIASGLLKDGRPVESDPDTGTASWWHLRMEIEEQRLDFAHHGRAGQRPWTRPNITNLLAFQIWTEHHLRGEPPPHLAVRSHMHRYADTQQTYPTRLIQTAAWQLATAYVHKVAPESIADIGGHSITIRDGVLDAQAHLFRPKGAHIWRAA